jgi:tRNA pseudouridine13 synthase
MNQPEAGVRADALPYAYGGPAALGQIKSEPDDFIVDEILGFEPCGEGEHVFLRIEKRGENTDYVARQLARFVEAPKQAVSYAGMKDRHGRTAQWFSVHLPGKRELDWTAFNSPTRTVLAALRHNRKLKKGALAGNRFEITVRGLQGDRERVDEILHRIGREGVPDYFGMQRFGHDGRNLAQAQALFRGELRVKDRSLRGIYLSAARSFIFNQVLARRVADGSWNRAIPGDVFMFTGSHSFFKDGVTPEIEERIQTLEIHPSGPLWGKGESHASDQALHIETEMATAHALFCEGLARSGMEMARRPLRLALGDLQWDYPAAGSLRLRFSLPAGAYATAVLREAVRFEQPIE